MDKLELYVYTAPIFQKEGLIKVGHCLDGRHKERINEQFNAANPEKPIILWVESLPDGKRDHHIHRQLEKNGIDRKKDGAGQEWFYATLDDVKKHIMRSFMVLVERIAFLLEKNRERLSKGQRNGFVRITLKKIVDAASHSNRFLLNAKMRFGKCFTGVHIAKELRAKKTIIVTYKPRVIGEWISAVNDHVDFSGWTGIRAKEGENPNTPFLKGEGDLKECPTPFVFVFSLQDLDISDSGEIKDRLKDVLKMEWDLLILMKFILEDEQNGYKIF